MDNSNLTLFVITSFLLLLFTSACSDPASSDGAQPVADPIIDRGKQIFTQNCASCHAITPDTNIVGPSLYGLANTSATRVKNQDAQTYLELSIIEPSIYVVEGYPDLMPSTFGKSLSSEDFDALIGYLLTLE